MDVVWSALPYREQLVSTGKKVSALVLAMDTLKTIFAVLSSEPRSEYLICAYINSLSWTPRDENTLRSIEHMQTKQLLLPLMMFNYIGYKSLAITVLMVVLLFILVDMKRILFAKKSALGCLMFLVCCLIIRLVFLLSFLLIMYVDIVVLIIDSGNIVRIDIFFNRLILFTLALFIECVLIFGMIKRLKRKCDSKIKKNVKDNLCSIGIKRGMDDMIHHLFDQDDSTRKTIIGVDRALNRETLLKHRKPNNSYNDESIL